MVEGFDFGISIHVISLEDSIKRQSHMKTQLQSLDMKFSIFSAVDGDLLSEDEIKDSYDGTSALSIRGKHLSPGEIGCALSHIRLFQEVVDYKLKAMCIFEDDVKIDPVLKDLLKKIQNMPSRWDVVFLGCDSRRVFMKSISCGEKFLDGYELRLALGVGPVKGTYAYIVSYAGAKKLLGLTQKFYKPIDSYTGDNSVLNIYMFTPNIVSHTNSFPSIIFQKLDK